jgi:phage tail P2-like protein
MWNTIDIVPSSIRNDPQVQAACKAIDAELQSIYDCIPSICFWPFVDQQVPPLLDVLAWEMHVDVWQGFEGDLTVEKKRELIAKSVDWHQHKGTKYAVEQMVQTVFAKGYVSEWYQYGGTPYHFRVILKEQIPPDKLDTLLTAINAVKNARSWMDEFDVTFQVIQQLYIGIAIARIKINKIPVATNPYLKPTPHY